MKWEHVFDPVTMKIDRKYANVWLEDLPDLSVECSVTKVSELLGEKIKVGSEEFSTRDSSLVDAASLLRPKRLAKNFPLKSSGSRISRVFLRQDIISLWNALVDEENTEELKITSAASGLGKSIYLCLIAVFARHFGIPVQYIGNTGDLHRQKVDDDSVACNYVGNSGAMLRKKLDCRLVARRYAAMLLFMNSGILDSLEPFYSGGLDMVSYYNLVKNLEDSKSVVNLTALFHIAQISAFFEASVAEDLLDPTKYSLYFSQGGLSLPSREYYLDQSAERRQIRSDYLEYIKSLFESTLGQRSLALFSMSSEEAASEILLLETRLANISLPLADLRDPNSSYNPVPISLIPEQALSKTIMRPRCQGSRGFGF